MFDFKIPEVGENIKEGTIVKVAVSVGSSVQKDQTLLEMETDKASLEIPSPVAGVIKEILVKEGAKVKIGQLAMKIEAGASSPASVPTPQPAKPAEAPRQDTKLAPTRQNLKDFGETSPSALAGGGPTPQTLTTQSTALVAAAPSVRRFAREIGVDVGQVKGSGPRGRISLEDVKAFAKMILTGQRGLAPGSSSGSQTPPLPNFAKFGETERKPMNNVRKKTAEHLSHAWAAIPHVTQFDKADITELEKVRKQYSTPTRKLTITPFLLKVMASALKQFPQFNASIDMATNEIIYKKYYHLGLAVDTERGLIVPVIRDVDKKHVLQIADELNEIAERARTKKTTIEEMQGGCLTLTNLGGIGGTMFTPIVNWPEVAILGISRGRMEPVYVDNQFIPRMMLPLSLSYDHRLIDGADGARFIRWIAEALEQPAKMELKGWDG